MAFLVVAGRCAAEAESGPREAAAGGVGAWDFFFIFGVGGGGCACEVEVVATRGVVLAAAGWV